MSGHAFDFAERRIQFRRTSSAVFHTMNLAHDDRRDASAEEGPHRGCRRRMDFKLSEEQKLLRDNAQKLAREVFKDKAAQWDRNAEVP